MEEFEKIKSFLKRLNSENGTDTIKFDLFSDGSCSICRLPDFDYLEASSVESLLRKIDNYQWDTNTNNPNTDPAKR